MNFRVDVLHFFLRFSSPKFIKLEEMQKTLPFWFLIVFLTSPALHYSQDTGLLRGFITDSLSGEALVSANILLEGTRIGVAADLNGFFSIASIPANKTYTVKASFLGYESKRVNVRINPDKTTQIHIKLLPADVRLQTIEKIGERVKDKELNIGISRISVRELELMPKGVETDVMRTLQFMPGVQSTGDVSARYYVRGGGSDQNLVLLNGIPVYNPFHAMGLFSIIDPEMINAIEFYKGGFTAEFGERISSVLNMVTKNGNKNRFAGTSSLSFLTGKASVEGPIPGGSFIVTARKSLFDNILKKYIYKDAPFDFYDYSFKVNYNVNSDKRHSRILLFGFQSGDKLKNNSLNSNYHWNNNLYGLNWFQVWESPLYSETTVSLSNFDAKVEPVNVNALERKNKVSDLSLKMDFTLLFDSKDELKFGYNIKTINTSLYLETENKTKTDISDFGANITLFTKYRLLRLENLKGDFGVRVNAASLADNDYVLEPRLNLTYQLNPLWKIKAAWGIYTQDMVTFTNENEIIALFEPWITLPGYMKAPSAVHYIVGMDYDLSEYLSFNVEAYYKKMQNITELNKNKFSPADHDLVAGDGESYGWETQLQIKDFYGISALCSYSLSWAYKEIDNWLYYPRYDSRHTGKVMLGYDLGRNWNIGANWMISSGLPFTQIESYYNKFYFDNLNDGFFLFESYSPYTILGSKNLGRLPFYHRLDLNLTKKFKLYFSNIFFSIDVINVYDRKNIFYFERETGKKVNMLPFIPTASFKLEL